MAAALLVLSLPAATIAQTVADSIFVDVIEVDVSVRDTRGRPVQGLDRGDFVAELDGDPLEILDFDAVRHAETGVQAPPAPGSVGVMRVGRLAIFFDESGLDAGERSNLARRLSRSLDRDLEAHVEVLIAGRQGDRLEIFQEFTRDRVALREAIDEAVARIPRSSVATDLQEILREIERAVAAVDDAPRASAPARARVLVARANAYLGESSQRVARSVDVLSRLVRLMGGLPGRKAIVYVGDGMALNPAYLLDNALRDAFSRFELTSDTRGVISGGGSGLGAIEGIADLAADRSVVVYALDVSRDRLTSSVSASESSMDAGRSGGSNPQETWTPGVSSRQRFDLRGAVAELTAPTGGRVLGQGERRPLDATLADLSTYYTISVASPGVTTQGGRLTVRVGDRRLRVSHRRSLSPRSSDALDADRTVARLLGGGGQNSIGAVVVVGDDAESEEGLTVLPVTIRVPVANLTVMARGQTHEGQLSIFFVTSDAAHRISEVRKTVLPVTLLNSELAEVALRQAEYRLDLRLAPGGARLAVGVRDDFDPGLALSTLDLTLSVDARRDAAKARVSP